MDFVENVTNNQTDTSKNLGVRDKPKINIDDLTQSSMGSINTSALTEFELFMNRMQVPFGTKDFTHQNFVGTGAGSIIYKIADDDYENFLKLYIFHVNGDNFGKLNIMEKPKDIGCLCLDFDVKQRDEGRLFTEEHIVKIIDYINDIVASNYKPKSKNQNTDDYSDDEDEQTFGKILQSYVLVKNEQYYSKEKSQYVDGFHIQYPNLILNYADRFFVYDQLKNKIESEKLFDDIKDELMDATNICDDSVILKNAWFMYGSGKTLGNKVHYYRIQYIFDENNEIVKLTTSNASNKILMDTLAVRKILHRTVEPIDKVAMQPLIEKIKKTYCANRITSASVDNYFKTPQQTVIGRTTIRSLNKPKIQSLPDVDVSDNEEDETLMNDKKYLTYKKKEDELVAKSAFYDEKRTIADLNIVLAKKYVKLLNPERAIPYSDWIYVCWALYGVSDTLFNEFVEFSKLCPRKFTHKKCQEVWLEAKNSNTKRRLGLSALRAWASEDNQNGFLEVLNEQISNHFEQCDCSSEFGMAILLHIMYGNVFKCSSLKNHSWWYFNGTRWEELEKGYKLSILMSQEVCAELFKVQAIYMQKAIAERGHGADLLRKKADSIHSIIKNLQGHAFKQRVIAECEHLFYHYGFEKILDNNYYLIGFANGVYDLKAGVFRKGIPEDYISASTEYNYEELDFENQQVKEVEQFMRDIQPDPKMNLYLWIYCSSFVEGGNKDQKFVIFTGSGSNGKSKLTILLQNALKQYYGTVPIELITKERGSASGAQPEMEDKKIVRALTMEEPEKGAKIYTSYIKLITGGTPIMARGLYKSPIYFIPQFKLLISCNDKPIIEADDNGTWRRMIVIVFGIKFVKEPKLPFERLMDRSLNAKIETWQMAFMWLLLKKYYPMYAEHDLDYFEPDDVRLATNQYKEDSNVFIEFFNSGEVLPDEKSKIQTKQLHEIFKLWFEQMYNGTKVPMFKKFNEFCIKTNMRVEGGWVYGYKMKVSVMQPVSEFD